MLAGPSEATAIGNALVQMIEAGEIKDLKDARRIVRKSFDIEIFNPGGEEKC